MEFYGKLWKVLEDYVSMPYMDMECDGIPWNFMELSGTFHDILKCKTINFPHHQF
jgi:hypothetical protein